MAKKTKNLNRSKTPKSWGVKMLDAVKRGNWQEVLVLGASVLDKDPVWSCAFSGQIPALRALIARFPHAWTDDAKALALVGAIQGDQEECARWLLEAGADPWRRESSMLEPVSVGSGDWHALHWAAAEGRFWALRLLENQSGCAQQIQQESFAGLAAFSGNMDAVEWTAGWLERGGARPEDALRWVRQDALDALGDGNDKAVQRLNACAVALEAKVLESSASLAPLGRPKTL
jgi:hypothetical protein